MDCIIYERGHSLFIIVDKLYEVHIDMECQQKIIMEDRAT